MIEQLTSLEEAVIASICELWPDYAVAVREQLVVARVTGRENTGGGIFTYFQVPQGVSPAPAGMPTSSHVEIDGLAQGMDFHLAVERGRVDHLEGHSYGEDTSRIDFGRVAYRLVR